MPKGNSKAIAETKAIIAAPTAVKQRGRPFPKGVSGNPKGRAKGSRNQATIIAEQLIDGQATELTERAIALAMGGNPILMKAMLDRLAAPRKSRTVAIKLPEIQSFSDLTHALAAINKALGLGEIDVEQLQALTKYVEGAGRALENKSVEDRLEAVERALAARQESGAHNDA